MIHFIILDFGLNFVIRLYVWCTVGTTFYLETNIKSNVNVGTRDEITRLKIQKF